MTQKAQSAIILYDPREKTRITPVAALYHDDRRKAISRRAVAVCRRRGAAVSIAGIVLAAGRSRRMGAPKPLLEFAGRSFLARVVQALRDGGCGEIVAVVGPREETVAGRIAEAAREEGARVVVNPLAEAEQIDSLRLGLHALAPEAQAAVVTPVDFPRIEEATVRALIEAFRQRQAPIVLPIYGGRRGHPILFAREVFPDLFADPLREGARTVVHAHAADLEEVRVEDAGILMDVDTPAEYRRLLEREGEG